MNFFLAIRGRMRTTSARPLAPVKFRPTRSFSRRLAVQPPAAPSRTVGYLLVDAYLHAEV